MGKRKYGKQSWEGTFQQLKMFNIIVSMQTWKL